jgi:hypothetical protein
MHNHRIVLHFDAGNLEFQASELPADAKGVLGLLAVGYVLHHWEQDPGRRTRTEAAGGNLRLTISRTPAIGFRGATEPEGFRALS